MRKKKNDYEFYYWQVPFRGIFIQLLLEEVEAVYERKDANDIYPDKGLRISVPSMAPPYLFDVKREKYLSQMPAIMKYLGETHELIPVRTSRAALAMKVVMDCHDILTEITNFYGLKMWDKKEWSEFREKRLSRWMKIFELTGLEHGIENGHYLLGKDLSIADIASVALFGSMLYSFPSLEVDLEKNAPNILKLIHRIESRKNIRPFLLKQREEWGRIYCGGQIEASLRDMLD